MALSPCHPQILHLRIHPLTQMYLYPPKTTPATPLCSLEAMSRAGKNLSCLMHVFSAQVRQGDALPSVQPSL